MLHEESAFDGDWHWKNTGKRILSDGSSRIWKVWVTELSVEFARTSLLSLSNERTFQPQDRARAVPQDYAFLLAAFDQSMGRLLEGGEHPCLRYRPDRSA